MINSVAYLSEQLFHLLEERADIVATETGCVRRTRKFSGASLLQTLVFGWQQHPDASLEQLASVAELHDVEVTDTAVQKRFTPKAAQFLHRVLEEACSLVVQAAQDVPVALLRRFSVVILEDSSSIALPDELAEVWQGCGGNQEHTQASVKLHVRWELKRGRLWGPALTDGRASDRRSPFSEEEIVRGSLEIRDLGYFQLDHLEARRAAGAYSLTRWQTGTALFTNDGKKLSLADVLPPRVGQLKELPVRVGARHWLPMRLLMLRVPKEVGDQRREDLLRDAQRRGQTVSEETLRLADWTILLTDVPAKLIGVLLQHWLIVLFAWCDPQRSLVKLAKVVRDTAWLLMDALAGHGSICSAVRLIGRRMRSGCQMNTRKKHPNSAQLLEQEAVEWALSW